MIIVPAVCRIHCQLAAWIQHSISSDALVPVPEMWNYENPSWHQWASSSWYIFQWYDTGTDGTEDIWRRAHSMIADGTFLDTKVAVGNHGYSTRCPTLQRSLQRAPCCPSPSTASSPGIWRWTFCSNLLRLSLWKKTVARRTSWCSAFWTLGR